MNKRSNREEIKAKEKLQSLFLALITQSDKRIMLWLGSADDTKQHSYDEFFKLPIVKGGSGVSFENQESSIRTIDDHIKERKNLRGHSSGKFDNVKLAVNATDSQALKSLKNRIRSDNRKNAMTDSRVSKPKKNDRKKEVKELDSDSDQELAKEKFGKKTMGKKTFGKKRGF